MRIKELIKAKGLTQKEFAAALGMSPVGLNQLINGKPSYPTLEKFAAALGVPIWQLFVSPSEVSAEPPQDDFCAFVRCNGVSHTPETLADLRRLVDELESGARR